MNQLSNEMENLSNISKLENEDNQDVLGKFNS